MITQKEILVRVLPDRAERARRLLGASRQFSPQRDAVADLVAERAVRRSEPEDKSSGYARDAG